VSRTHARANSGDTSVAASVRKHFDREASGYAEAYERDSNSGYSFRIRKRRVLELFDQPGGAVLDVGCGPGVVVEELVTERGCEFWGVDVSAEMIARAKERYSSEARIHFAVGNVERLDFPDQSFDAVLSMGVLEYLVDPSRAVEEMYRVLKLGGTLIVTVPNVTSPFRIWHRIVWRPVLRLLRPLERWFPALGRLASPVKHREFRLEEHRKLYEKLGGVLEDVVYYNFKPFPSPLDYIFRRFQLKISARLERYCRGRLRFLGTGFIMKVHKPEAASN
jgi:ubiquinone/menaquinone biosynthesis C-methylase UbiE